MTADGSRIAEVQSLRAIAILLVAGYHYFASWTMPIDGNNLYPDTLASQFQYAWLGVELFFMVSGFVISMTLSRSRGAGHFLRKRVIRLWPSLLIALPIVWVVGNRWGPDMYAHSATHLFTSFTLIDPQLLNSVLPFSTDWTTAVLWTMWIEIQFYLLAALLFFAVRRYFLVALTLVTVVTSAVLEFVELPSVTAYLPWFLAGAVFHRIWVQGSARSSDVFLLAGVLGFEMWRLWHYAYAGAIWLPVFFFLAFVAIIRQWQVTVLLRSGTLVFLGEISYEFYLVHDTVGVSVITSMLDGFGFSAGTHLFAAVIGFLTSLALAYAVYRLSRPIRAALASTRRPVRV